MARTRGAPQANNGRQRRQENLASLSAEVLRLRLQSLNLPITGSKAELVHRLKAATQRPRADNPPPAGRVDKRTARKRAVRPVRTRTLTQVVNNDALLADHNDARDDVNDDASSAASEDDLDEPLDVTSILSTSTFLHRKHSLPRLRPSSWQLYRTRFGCRWTRLYRAVLFNPSQRRYSPTIVSPRRQLKAINTNDRERPPHSAFSVRWTRTWRIKYCGVSTLILLCYCPTRSLSPRPPRSSFV